MHEFTLTQNLLDTALKNAGSRRILRVNLLIGPFSQEREESIAAYWRDLATGSFGEDAELHFSHMPVATKCLDCSGAFYLVEEVSMCMYCSGEKVQRLSGDEVRLESIEVK
jgi:Zn finger protein HypA/HybF involved in hydrogenase expression